MICPMNAQVHALKRQIMEVDNIRNVFPLHTTTECIYMLIPLEEMDPCFESVETMPTDDHIPASFH